jgi:hypothetical protein
MELSIIILNYNTKDLTIECINSLVEQYKQEFEKEQFEIILVDNASSDDSLEAIGKLKTIGLKIIESKENLGFSKGCNLGAKNAIGEYLLFLNSDTEIKDQGFVKMLDYVKKNENVGILGGALKNENGTSQSSAGKFYNLVNLFLMLIGFERLGFLRESPRAIKQVDWVSGAALMIKRKIFEKIGGFEKELFMYGEDMELCYRANKKGFSTYFYPEITLFHKERGSSNRTFAILNIYQAILFFYRQYKPNWQYQIARFLLYSKSLILKNVGVISKKKYLVETYGQTLELF